MLTTFVESVLRFAVPAGIGVLVVWALWRATRPKPLFRIVVDGVGVQSADGLPKHKERTVREFFQRDVAIEAQVTILGMPGPNGFPRIKFQGDIHPSTQQQIRNFLKMEL